MASRETVAAGLGEAIRRVVDERSLTGFVPHGNAKWSPAALAAAALLWAWGLRNGLIERYAEAREIAGELVPGRTVPASYQGFISLVAAHSDRLLAAIVPRLRGRMREAAGPYWRVGRWAVFAVDGTRVEVPKTAANERHFAKPGRGRRDPNARPQAWLTVLWHVGLGLPWAFRHGPGFAGERDHLADMLPDLPEGALLAADAGFTGYGLWKALRDRGHSFLIRVGSNVRLLEAEGRLRRRGDVALLWPEQARRSGAAPLVLRLVRLRHGRRELVLATDVLDRGLLSDREALAIYRRRWGVEVFVRSFKQTFGKGRLRSDAPHNAERELEWSFVALWSLQLLGAAELIGEGFDPTRLSTAEALRNLQAALAAVLSRPLDLFAALAALADDGYRRRDKSSRDYPRKKREPAPSAPSIRRMRDDERIAYTRLAA